MTNQQTETPKRSRNGSTRPAIAQSIKRRLGAYYTPESAADFMASWLIDRDGMTVLEPSFGDGIFLRAVEQVAELRGFGETIIEGVEIDADVRARAVADGIIKDRNAILSDFVEVAEFPVDAVIGNPPYVRFRHLPEHQRSSAIRVSSLALERPMDPAGSLWVPFLLHAMEFLKPGGRLAFVLPFEFTYVRYGLPVWEHLARNFGKLQVLRTHQRLFPEILQDVVVLLADDYGGSTETVRYVGFERVQDLLDVRSVFDRELRISDVLSNERVFMRAVLGHHLNDLLSGTVHRSTVPARELCTFNIGYVTGDKRFFHPSVDVVDEYNIPRRSLRKAMASARSMRKAGLFTSELGDERLDQLFVPTVDCLSEGERAYITHGEDQAVSDKYKCRIRNPWYAVPGIRVPDVLLSVFSERPIMMVNDSEIVASNSLLCGYSRGPSAHQLATAWYTSLTMLGCELDVHALGGGVMVLVPRETGTIRLAAQVETSNEHLTRVDHALRTGHVKHAYELGDREILVNQLGFTSADVDDIRSGIEALRHWRESHRTSRN